MMVNYKQFSHHDVPTGIVIRILRFYQRQMYALNHIHITVTNKTILFTEGLNSNKHSWNKF
jgi:hypothetical protein